MTNTLPSDDTPRGILIYDEAALEVHPSLKGINFKWTVRLSDSPETHRLVDILISRASVSALVGLVTAAPTKVAVCAVEDLLEATLGDVAFTDKMKQDTGRIVKAIMIQLGARHTHKGVAVTTISRYSRGSTYEFARFARRPMVR